MSLHPLLEMGMWPIEDGHLVLNGVTSTAKALGCSLVKVYLSLNGTVTIRCLCCDGVKDRCKNSPRGFSV